MGGEGAPWRLVLASASPRRRALLEQVGLCFEVRPVEDAEDTAPANDAPAEHARKSAETKAVAASRADPGVLVLGADTVVALDGRVLGKPRDEAEAVTMLAALSGREHEVHTGVAMGYGGRVLLADVVTTRVRFRRLSPEEIADYVRSGEPMDKAGAYGIQGRGALLVAGIEGCYSNVVGLPLSRTWELLGEARRLVTTRGGGAKC
jgi:nucleoside triphosphate pyrophosphatase